MTYIGKDTVALLIHAALQTEGEVVAADHYTSTKTLLEGLHVWLDPREVQPLDIREEESDPAERREDEREELEGGGEIKQGESIVK